MNAIDKLQAERQRLVGRLAEIDKILGQYEELQRVAESYFTTNASHTPPSDSGADPVAMRESKELETNLSMSAMPGVRRPKTPMVDFERAVIEVLSEAEEPLDRSVLYKALLDRDVVIGSPDESSDLNTLSARMSRMKEKVVNVRGHGYWLKDRAFPDGGYEPQGGDDTLSPGDRGDLDMF